MPAKLLVIRLSGLYLGEEVSDASGVFSGISHKKSSASLRVEIDRVMGDAQADPKHHGGLDRVLHISPGNIMASIVAGT
ncbi:molybdenum cofactor sulfurase [Shewanella benthica]|uniref:Molybdenum cofactor sulfurase n=1 Tax=Shewanella benthica TaxID=43661 RepID=A0A330LYB6_9GAMM|nr:molybdenum cofactor sulfurase [Shewanella benthica]